MEQDTRPWGKYVVLFEAQDYKVKRIEVNAGMRFSLQKHSRRAETWIVVSGEGKATVGTNEIPVRRGSVIQVAKEEVHRMHSTGQEPLVFIEVQFGDYLGEDDIVRLEDDFKRAK
jgi:mannose-6-phosphate isomerase-like protein (cupin superfamily)